MSSLTKVGSYVPLHTHSMYSQLDGLNSPAELVARAKEIGASHLSLTDHGTMAGHREFQKACHEQGVVPILGNEVYFSSTDRFDKRTNASRKDGTSIYNHLTVLAQDGAGWQNLSALSEEAWRSGYYHKPRCLLPGQEIVTRDGYKVIEDIVIGDYVLDHQGQWSPVTNISKNNYRGLIYGFELSNRYGRVTWMTPEHPVLIRDYLGNLSWQNAEDVVAGRRIKTQDINSWNSWVCFPRVQSGSKQTAIVESSLGWGYLGEGLWKKHSARKTMPGTNHYTNLNKEISVDCDFARFIGFFIAEGWTTNRGEIGFAFHRKETEYADFVCDYIEHLTGRRPTQTVYDDKQSRDVRISHGLLAENLERWCGKYARNKKIPDFIMESEQDVLLAVWIAVIDGDGCWQKGSPHASLTQTSRQLAWQMKTLAATINKDFCSVREYTSNGFDNARQAYSLNFSYNAPVRRTISDDDYVYRPVKSIATKVYDGEVYNFEVAGSHSYTTDFVTHNCDMEILEKYADGLIVLSGCLNGPIAKAIERGDEPDAIYWAETFKEIFGERFLIEVQAHNPQAINHGLLAIADKLKIRPVMASDCHYAKPEDLWAEEAMLILSTSPDRLKDIEQSRMANMELLEKLNYLYPDRKMSFQEYKLYMRSLVEEQAMFEAGGIDRKDIYENTNFVASMVGEYEYHSDLDMLPVPKYDAQERLESLARSGAKKLFGTMTDEYSDRLEEELTVIRDKSLARYFLVLADMVSWSKKQGILVGPGRGSGAGSLVNYCLGITSIDPIKYNLLFARFLDPERNDPADVDIDVASSRRNEIKRYMERKFKHVAGINTFGLFKDKNLIKDACRVMCLPLGEVQTIVDSIETFDEFLTAKHTEEFRRANPDVVRIAKYLHGRIRQVGMHAGGLVVSNEPLSRYVPIETRKDPSAVANERIPVVALDMGDVEAVGLIKIDLLGLKTLSVIQDTLDAIKARTGESIDLLGLDLEDKGVYDMISAGHTTGIFQVEAAPYTKLVMDMGLDNFHDLVASNALVRPGAANTIGKTYIARKQGRDFAPKVDPAYDSITADTYGVVLYQEQVMLLCRDLAGLSWGDANKIRRIIGKKKDPHEFEQFRQKFVTGASEKVGEPMANQLWSDFEAHASYSFNASHAVAYSMVSYWTAWLKKNYPLEFMFALLRNESSKQSRANYLLEAKRLGLKVLLPHVNDADVEVSITGDRLMFGLADVKYISEIGAKKIMQMRPFTSYADLLEKAKKKGSGINRRAIQYLNMIGAAEFSDNPLQGNERDNFYEVLGIPNFSAHDLPAQIGKQLSYIESFKERGSFVFYAIATEIKKGSGWSRVTIMDSTGSAGIFHTDSTQIQKGKMYLFLVCDNSIIRYIEPDDLGNVYTDPFLRYLDVNKIGIQDTQRVVIAFATRRTKSGQHMGTAVLARSNKEIETALVFPKMFSRALGKLKPGAVVEVKYNKLDDGGLAVKEIA